MPCPRPTRNSPLQRGNSTCTVTYQDTVIIITSKDPVQAPGYYTLEFHPQPRKLDQHRKLPKLNRANSNTCLVHCWGTGVLPMDTHTLL